MARRYTLFDPPPAARIAAGGLGIFDAPGQARPAAPQLGIFDSPEAHARQRARQPAPTAPEGGQAPEPAPTAPEGRPQAPRPAPRAPEAPAAPRAPGRAPGRPGPDLRALKRDRRFQQFLNERYQRGDVRVPHPLPKLRRRYPQGIKFWTAMKYPAFQGAVAAAFEAWKRQPQQAPAGRGRPRAPEQPARPREPEILERVMPDDVIDRIRAVMQAGPPRAGREGTLEVAHRGPADWRAADDELLDIVRDGERVGRDTPLGQSSTNAPRRRRMRLGDREHDFVVKDRDRERYDVRVGIDDLAGREQAYYGVDRLLGDGTVVPPTLADRTSAYQALVPGAQDIYAAGNQATPMWRIPTDDLVRHPDVQRITVLDAVMGHEDRHPGNVMFSWTDPDSRDISNLRFHAIDNGYSMAEGLDKRGASSFDIRDPWMATTNLQDVDRVKDRWNVQRRILSDIPEQTHEKLRKVDRDKFLRELVRSGIKDQEALTAAAVRLAVLQDNPKALAPIIRRQRDFMGGGWEMPRSATQKAQQEWQWLSHSAPEQLIRDYSELPASTLDVIRQAVRRAVA